MILKKYQINLKLKVLGRKIAKLKNKFLKKTIPGTGAMFAQKKTR